MLFGHQILNSLVIHRRTRNPVVPWLLLSKKHSHGAKLALDSRSRLLCRLRLASHDFDFFASMLRHGSVYSARRFLPLKVRCCTLTRWIGIIMRRLRMLLAVNMQRNLVLYMNILY